MRPPIKRTAKENGGTPLGTSTFRTRTGIKPYDWGLYWARLSDAQKEAGLQANVLNAAIPDAELLMALALLPRELGKYPAQREMSLKRRKDSSFPDSKVFRRLGNSDAIARRLFLFSRDNQEFVDIAAFLPEPQEAHAPDEASSMSTGDPQRVGYVYMLKFRGKDYKIGFSNDPERRYGEIATKMPEPPVQIHTIRTDDLSGVEAYWHRRFASKQIYKKSEWFQLSPSDVQAFRRWKNIY